MQVCTSLQTDDHTSTPPLSFLMPFLLTNQQHQSTEGTIEGMIGRKSVKCGIMPENVMS